MLILPLQLAVFETNRGCPFRCTYCYWAAYNAKVHKFSANRVFDEYMVVRNRSRSSICRRQLWHMERDVDIARLWPNEA